MRLFSPLFFFLTLAARLAGAQCTISTFPVTAGCAVPFRARLVAPGSPNDGQEVSIFCLGAVYRFEHCAARNLPAGIRYLYTADPLAANCMVGPFATNDESVYRTPPVQATATSVVVTEAAGSLSNGTLYQRTFPVAVLAAPTFAVLPCPAGNVRLLITGPANNTTFFVGTAAGRRHVVARDTVLTLPAGTATLTVSGRPTGSLCELSTSAPIPAIAPRPTPAITSLVVDGALPGPATFSFPAGNLPLYYRYTLVRAVPGGYTPVANVAPGATSFPLPLAQPGCYALRRSDLCHTDSLVSAEICTIGFSGQALPGRNELTLAYGGPPQALTLLRNGTMLATLPAGTTTYPDRAVVCGTTYRYQVQADLGGGRFSRSNEVRLLATTGEVPPTPTVRASFDLFNAVELTAALPAGAAVPPGSVLRYRRRSGGSTVATELAAAAASAAAPPRLVRDSTALAALLAAPPCYTVRLVDVCRQSSPESPAACPALLSATPAPGDPATTNLSYTPLQNPGGSFSYMLLVLAPDNSELRRQAVSGGSAVDVSPLTDPQRLRYRLEITGGGLPAPSYSNLATVRRPLSLAIPTAFTPNGDGLNDVLELKGRFLDKFSFVVVDRNGQEVFRATDRSTTWDGRINGHAPVNATYIWRFEQADADGKPQAQTGTVMIVN